MMRTRSGRRLAYGAVVVSLLAAMLACNMPRPATPTLTPTVTPTLPPPQATAARETLAAQATVTITPPPTIAEGTEPPPAPSPVPPTMTPLPPQPTPEPSPTPTPENVLIQSFEITPAELDPGDPVTLIWQTTAEQVTLNRLDAEGRIAEFWEVPPGGTMDFTTREDMRNHITFMLSARAGELQETASATAILRCPVTWFFDNPPDECPAAAPLISNGAAEHFERGLMIWMEQTGQIFVFYDDGGRYGGFIYRAYEAVPDAWSPGMPEDDPSIVPPEGLYQPVRGFGVAWREPEGVYYHRRERLGWAVEPEFPITTAYQCNSAPRYATCYLQGPDGVIVLEPEGTGWHLWQGPEG